MRKNAIILVLFFMITLTGCSKNEVPVIEFGEDAISVELGSTFALPDCEGIDPEDGTLSCVISGDTVDTNSLGDYTVIYTVKDSKNKEVSSSLVVSVVDTTVPVITIDNSQIVLEVNETFVSPTCTVLDNQETLSCVEDVSTLNTSMLGSYTVSYYAIDSSGNRTTTIAIDVIVQDTTSPIITLSSYSEEIEYGETMPFPVCTVNDNYDVSLTCSKDNGGLNVNVPGIYNVVYSVTDSSNNIAALKTLEVTVVDKIAPTLTVNAVDMTIEAGETFETPVCSSIDAIDGNIDCVFNPSIIDVNTVGTTLVTVSAVDLSGNTSVPVTFNVTVEDTLAPIIELEYDEYKLMKDTTFNGIECVVIDGSTDTCILEGTVDTTQAGEYPIKYVAVDAALLRTEVDVIVTVVENSIVMYDNVLFNLTTGEVVKYLFNTGNDIIIPDEIYDVPVTILGFELSSQDFYVNSISIGGQITEFNDCFDNAILTYEDVEITGSNPDAYIDRWQETQLPYPLFGEYYFDEYYGRITGYIGEDTVITVPTTVNDVAVVSIGAVAYGTRNIDTLTVPGTVISIEDHAFNGANIVDIIIEEGVQSIGSYAFTGSYFYDKTVVIPESVVDIKRACFNFAHDTEIIFTGGGDRFYGSWLEIGFELEDLPIEAYILQDGLYFVHSTNTIIAAEVGENPTVIPATIGGHDVLHIGDYVFASYPHTTVTLPEGLLSIGRSAFYFSDLVSLTIPASLETIGEDAFYYNNDLTTVTVLGDSTRFEIIAPPTVYITEGAFTYTDAGLITSYDPLIGGYDVIVPESINGVKITHIGGQVFKGLDIESMVLPEGLETIGSETFQQTLITELIIPSSVEYIGSYIFSSNADVAVTVMGDDSRFYDSYFYMDHLTVEYNGMYFDERTNTILWSDSNEIDLDLVIPSQINGYDVLYIADYAFGDMELTSLVLPEGLLGIGEYAFAENEITSLNLPSTLKYIGQSAFEDNEYLVGTLTIPVGLKVIEYEAFGGCGFTEIVLPEGFEYINARVFTNNEIDTINLPNSIIAIGYKALNDNQLTGTLVLPTELKTIDGLGFGYNDISTITFNEKLEYIGENAFVGNLLIALDIPNSVTYIGESAFAQNNIDTLVLPNNIKYIMKEAFSENNIIELIIPNSVVEIKESAFKHNKIIIATIPEGVVLIGKESFSNNELTDIYLPSTLYFIGDDAFANQLISGGLVFHGGASVLARFSDDMGRIT